MGKRIITSLLVSLFVSISLFADGYIDKQTYVYSVKDGNSLKLDRYYLKDDVAVAVEVTPCIVFMFGGGFAAGERDGEQYVDYFRKLVERGYQVVSIDYRLGMKNIGDGSQIDPMRFAALLTNSITMAVEDLFDATTFVYNHADDWNIEKSEIITNGSSAGAVAVLHGEYAICNKSKLTERLPLGFNYAGTIAFAGAIFSTSGDLKWQTAPSPIQMFHGDADRNVPFDKTEMLQVGLYGSKHIAKQLQELNTPYYFYKVENAAHEIAERPMRKNINEICSFINKLIIGKDNLMINTGEVEIGKPEMKKDFELMDYIKANFGG